jgi:hypothetical protein
VKRRRIGGIEFVHTLQRRFHNEFDEIDRGLGEWFVAGRKFVVPENLKLHHLIIRQRLEHHDSVFALCPSGNAREEIIAGGGKEAEPLILTDDVAHMMAKNSPFLLRRETPPTTTNKKEIPLLGKLH